MSEPFLFLHRYPAAGSIQLTSHETFAYTCVQVIAGAYQDVGPLSWVSRQSTTERCNNIHDVYFILFLLSQLVRDAQAITNDSDRQQLLWDIMQGKRSKDMTVTYLGQRSYDSPVGNFSVSKIGNPVDSYVVFRSRLLQDICGTTAGDTKWFAHTQCCYRRIA